jgi:hypothetical protein
MDKNRTEEKEAKWKTIYKAGAVAAIFTVLVAVAEIAITFLPGGGRETTSARTVIDWFTLYQTSPFMGMRNLGLLNFFLVGLSILFNYALYAAHRRVERPLAGLALIISIIGMSVFYATNRAFAMLALSNQYAAATSDTQRALLLAAGQAMLAVGESHTPGTFLAFFISEIAGILMSVVMLRGKIFSQASGIVGILAFGSLLIFEVCSSFIPALFQAAIIFALVGGVLSMVWYILVARKLFQLAQEG